jgi:hypothetical protein
MSRSDVTASGREPHYANHKGAGAESTLSKTIMHLASFSNLSVFTISLERRNELADCLGCFNGDLELHVIIGRKIYEDLLAFTLSLLATACVILSSCNDIAR